MELADKLFMKKIIFVLFLFLPVFCFAQNKNALTHFWSIPWGLPAERVQAILEERGLEPFQEENVLIAEALYEGENAVMVLLFNRANRFHSGNVIYLSDAGNVMSRYEHYRFVLARRYCGPNTAVEFYEEPFIKGDGRVIEAISTENAFFFTKWEFGNGCLASVAIFSSLDVALSFSNPAFADGN